MALSDAILKHERNREFWVSKATDCLGTKPKNVNAEGPGAHFSSVVKSSGVGT